MDFNKYQPPVRTSLSDSELDAKVNSASQTGNGVEAVMELLVAQEALRASEDAEIAGWLAEMDANGSPEATLAAENYRRSLAGLAPIEALTTEQESSIEVTPSDPQTDPIIDDKPFSFLNFNTQPDEEPFEAPVEGQTEEQTQAQAEVTAETEPEIEIEIGIVEIEQEATVDTAHVVSSFEDLIAANAAEEEVSAIEEREAVAQVLLGAELEPAQNVTVPTDKFRNRKPASQLLTWLAINSTLVPFVLAWVMMGQLHLSWQVSLFDITCGFFAAGLLVSIASLAGKRSGLSTLVISRAIFGVGGNLAAAITIAISRMASIAFMVWLIAVIFVHQPDSAISDSRLFSLQGHAFSTGQAFGLGALAIAIVVALFAQPVQRWLQIVAGAIASLVMIALLVTLVTLGLKPQGYMVSEFLGSNSLTAIGLVVSVVLALWFTVAPNLAKSIPMKARGLRVVVYSLLVNSLWPAAIGAVAVLALATNPLLLAQFENPLYALQQNTDVSSTLILSVLVATAVSLLAWLSSAVAAFVSDVKAIVYRNSRALVVSTAALALALVVAANLFVRDFATVEYQLQLLLLAAVLTSAFAGLFLADVLLRRIAYHEVSLSRSYGFYKRFNPLGIITWVFAMAVGLCVAHVDFAGLEYTGFAQGQLGLKNDLFSAIDGTMLALATGFVLSFVLRVPNIKRQEREVKAIESRRTALNDIFVGNE